MDAGNVHVVMLETTLGDEDVQEAVDDRLRTGKLRSVRGVGHVLLEMK